MGFKGVPMRFLCAVVALVVPAGLVAGCGGKGGGSSSVQKEKPPAKFQITATGSKDDLQFKPPQKTEPGPVEITFTNNAKTETDAQLIQVQGNREDAEIVAMLSEAVEGHAVASWFKAAGGVGTLEPGENGKAKQILDVGTYYVVGGDDPPKGPLAKFTVGMPQASSSSSSSSGSSSSSSSSLYDLPKDLKVPAKIIATDYAFSGQNVRAGQPVEFRNEGKEWHHFIGGKVKGDATIEEIKKALESDEDEAQKLVNLRDGFETTVIDAGLSQVAEPNLEEGRYVFFCFVADRGGGPPHVAKGMVSEIKVTE